MKGKYYLVGMLLTAAVLAATAVAYPHLPGSVATHWNMRGEPDGYSPSRRRRRERFPIGRRCRAVGLLSGPGRWWLGG